LPPQPFLGEVPEGAVEAPSGWSQRAAAFAAASAAS